MVDADRLAAMEATVESLVQEMTGLRLKVHGHAGSILVLEAEREAFREIPKELTALRIRFEGWQGRMTMLGAVGLLVMPPLTAIAMRLLHI